MLKGYLWTVWSCPGRRGSETSPSSSATTSTTWSPRYVAGRGWVADLDTGLWLVESDHVTWILLSDRLRAITWPGWWLVMSVRGLYFLYKIWCEARAGFISGPRWASQLKSESLKLVSGKAQKDNNFTTTSLVFSLWEAQRMALMWDLSMQTEMVRSLRF